MGVYVKKVLALCVGFYLILPSAMLAQQKAELPPADEALLKQISKGFSQIAKKATPAVVYIESQGVTKSQSPLTPRTRQKQGPFENPFDRFNDEFFNRFFGFPYPDQKQQQKESDVVRGSGFLVSRDGYILTNNHVVDKATKVNVTLNNGKKVTATVIGSDSKTDLAIIKIEGNDFPYLQFGDSDTLDVGDWAIAVGNPFGLQASVTVGVVSAKGRNQLHIADFEDFIQTDAAINPGNSGGPLLNVQGEVIGVNTAIVTGSGGYMGIGFAIPSNMVSRIMDQLIKDGTVTRGFLGVTLQPIDSDLADFYHLDSVQGALVTDVIKGSPADLAGIKQEDIIVSYNGTPVDNLSAFRNAVSLMDPGSKLKLTINREGRMLELKVTVSVVPSEIVGPNSPLQQLGIKVQNLTPEISEQLGLPGEKGVVITQIEPGSPAAEASLQPGSLIVAVNRRKVTNIDEFNLAVNEAAKDGRILLMVRQGEAIRFVALHFGK